MKIMDKKTFTKLRDTNRKIRMLSNFDKTLPWVNEYINRLNILRGAIVRDECNNLSPLGNLYDFQYELLINGGGVR